MTDAESRLWRRLRQLPMLGSHFRRQVSIDPYVVDFACMASRLIVEVDGSQHGDKGNLVRDDARTRWLEARGCRVIRFWNSEISTNIEGVVATIHTPVYGSSDVEPTRLEHSRSRKRSTPSQPTPARFARRPSPSRRG